MKNRVHELKDIGRFLSAVPQVDLPIEIYL
jgi:hypothetical protein